ncbi:omptin family outer membrane protease [Amaricoccus solimangrovi]|uniref:Omptin family outer membrane protease n=1 Tax=Amaricoccus solimangrovi TaxID=2589815 RepID=A0A501WZB1_9RHOB|nr:omptin family outer membrane protease [Amaricoccus solimangrovi]TPE53754.1 omptin family outer membrane protease [Amaricoccus solimangrovi]
MIKAVCLGLALASCAGMGLAQDEAADTPATTGPVSVVSGTANRLSDRLSLETYLGYLSGESNEYVYNNGARTSRLTWTIEDAMIVGSRVNFAATNWLSLGLGGWASLASDNTMDDYDWLRDDIDSWSDWSHHPDTDLERAFEFDLSAQARVLEWRGIWFDGLAGYQVRNYKWRASGGHYVYSDYDFRDSEGNFSGPQVDYQQWWRTPYLGVAAGYALPGLRLSGRVIASPFAQVSDKDVHIENGQSFTGDFGNTQMAAVTLRAEHDLTPSWTLSGEANYQRFWEARGDMTVNYLNLDGWNSELSDAAGASNDAMILSLGLNYRF